MSTVECHHQPYHGRCAHCDIRFTDGLPNGTAVSRSELDASQAETRRIKDALERAYDIALLQRCERNTPWDWACVAIAKDLGRYIQNVGLGLTAQAATQAVRDAIAMEAAQAGETPSSSTEGDSAAPEKGIAQ